MFETLSEKTSPVNNASKYSNTYIPFGFRQRPKEEQRHCQMSPRPFFSLKEGGKLTQHLPRGWVRAPIPRRLGYTASELSCGVGVSSTRKALLKVVWEMSPLL